MSNGPQWQAVLDLVVTYPTQPQILVQQQGDQWMDDAVLAPLAFQHATQYTIQVIGDPSLT